MDKTSPQVIRLDFNRGNAIVSSHDVTVAFNADGILSMTGAHVSGENTGLALPPSGLGSDQAKYTARHVLSNKHAYLDVVIVRDGMTGVDAIPGGARVSGALTSALYPNQNANGSPNDGEIRFTAGRLIRVRNLDLSLIHI